MNIGDQPAFPQLSEHPEAPPGLTKREHFAALAMQGLCASEAYAESSFKTIADMAVTQADDLLAALEDEA